MNIAIDGPSGAGKSTIARKLAARLGILYLDTGAMYRAIGLKALRAGIDCHSEEALTELLKQTELDVQLNAKGQRVLLDGEDVSDLIRTAEVSQAASDVSSVPVVRRRLVAQQQQIASRQDLVLDGRDIGTFVLPQATFKFFLTAEPQERARRRLADLRAAGDMTCTLEDVLAAVNRRDQQDSTRAMAPLAQAEDAILIDSTDLNPEEVLHRILAVICSKHKHD